LIDPQHMQRAALWSWSAVGCHQTQLLRQTRLAFSTTSSSSSSSSSSSRRHLHKPDRAMAQGAADAAGDSAGGGGAIDARAHAVLSYWLGADYASLKRHDWIPPEASSKWFFGGPEVDKVCGVVVVAVGAVSSGGGN
jgi:hypothetical protein